MEKPQKRETKDTLTELRVPGAILERIDGLAGPGHRAKMLRFGCDEYCDFFAAHRRAPKDFRELAAWVIEH